MDDRRVPLLFVINQLTQGGAERYVFEVCRALDKRRFDVHVLTRRGVGSDQHYYTRLTDAGVAVHPVKFHMPDFRRQFPSLWHSTRYRRMVHGLSSLIGRAQLRGLLEKFRIVSFVQIENYYALELASSQTRAVVVHLMSNRFQYAFDPYDECHGDANPRFVAFDRSQIEEIGASVCQPIDIFEWPLGLNLSEYPPIGVPAADGEPLRIGVFTRLSAEKPIEPLLEAFAALTKTIDARLHIYGGGDQQLFTPAIARLGIGDRVRFEGHQPNLVETLRQARLSMCWLMSVGTLLGYASLEISACGVPMMFWNFGAIDYDTVRAETLNAVHSFNSVPEFVRFAEACLTDRGKLLALGQSLQAYMAARHDISKNIAELERYYLQLAG